MQQERGTLCNASSRCNSSGSGIQGKRILNQEGFVNRHFRAGGNPNPTVCPCKQHLMRKLAADEIKTPCVYIMAGKLHDALYRRI